MKVVIAIDSFKGSMSSMEAGMAAREGVLRACDAQVVVRPLADGGEGTTEALVEGLGGTYAEVSVTGPMGEPVTARYGILQTKKESMGDADSVKVNTACAADNNGKAEKLAVMEMAEASGITLVKREDLNPWRASTTGVGQMIRDAIAQGCREFLIGIGGSATTEGGIGMLQALGYEFYDKNEELLPPVFSSLGRIARIDDQHIVPELEECHFQIACDVTNPLCGENGAVYVFGPQKGVRLEEREEMDRQMRHFAEETERYLDEKESSADIPPEGRGCHPARAERTRILKNASHLAGAGAAGGLGFAFLSYLPNVELKSGISIVLDAIRLEQELSDADVVLTGEGRLDGQTAMGKVPVGVAHLAKKYGCRVIAFAGSVTDDAAACNAEGIDAYFPIVRGVTTLDEAMDRDTAKKNMSMAVEQVFRLVKSCGACSFKKFKN
ncbi:MAG: glycerate kinase [Lachnospiraceae bacterium]|nr:glycerate kinase [Lachnospiraceae bacterium]